MAALRRLLLRLIHAFRPERAEADLAREVAAHLALLEDEYQRRGMSPEQAHTEARKALGVEQAKHGHRDTRSFCWLDELLTDVKYAVRRFRSRPGASALAVAMLAIAVGLSTAMFTIVDALIVRPLPFPHAERLTRLEMGTDTGRNTLISSRVFAAWRNSPAFDRVEGVLPLNVLVETDGGPVAHRGVIVTPALFDLLGARALRGRLFDLHAQEPEAVVLSETLWRTAFQGDETILGRTVRLDGEPFVVVGILPASFRFPEWNTNIWRARELVAGDEEQMQAVARIAAGVPAADAFRMATELAHAAEPSTPSGFSAWQEPLVWTPDTYYERAVPFLAAAVGLVVLVLCANVSSLLLTRLRARRREFGVCAALGASRGRLIRQTVMESAITGICGAAAGVAIAWMLVSMAAALIPQAFLRASLNPVALDGRAMFVTVVAGLVATVAAGMAPVWLAMVGYRASGNPIAERAGTHTRTGRLAVRGLLMAEVAFTCALLVGATLLVRSFVNFSATDRGFDPRGMATLWFSFENTATTAETRAVAADEVRAAMLALPRVSGAAWSSNRGRYYGNSTSDLPDASPVRLPIEVQAVGADYFDLYGLQLLRGRWFSAGDTEDVAIIGESIANALWPDVDPIGRTFERGNTRVRVVGVVREPRHSLVDPNQERADMFVSFEAHDRYASLNLRCDGSCPSEGEFRHRSATTGFAELSSVSYLDEVFARDLEQPRASAALAGTFALVALIASAVGLFGVLSYAVQERRREFGIRAAIGATPAAIAKVIFREGAIVGITGLVVGCALAAALASTLASLSYEVTAFDPLSVAVVIATLALTILLALWRPARTAARTDPALLLREE